MIFCLFFLKKEFKNTKIRGFLTLEMIIILPILVFIMIFMFKGLNQINTRAKSIETMWKHNLYIEMKIQAKLNVIKKNSGNVLNENNVNCVFKTPTYTLTKDIKRKVYIMIFNNPNILPIEITEEEISFLQSSLIEIDKTPDSNNKFTFQQ